MGTRGDVTVVTDDHYYSLYQPFDMYPEGHMAALLEEAAEITRNDEWDSIAEGWTQKAWLHAGDNALPEALRNTVQHPDGDTCRYGDWANNMVPRASRQELIDEGNEFAAQRIFSPDAVHPAPAMARPGWRRAADMPAMPKEDFCVSQWKQYGVVVDLDHNEIVCLAYRSSGEPHVGTHCPIAAAPLDDPSAIEEIALWTRERDGKLAKELDPPPPLSLVGSPGEIVWHDPDERFDIHPSMRGVPRPPLDPYATYASRVQQALSEAPSIDAIRRTAWTKTGRDWRTAPTGELRDGQWGRPPGFPSISGTPANYPAKVDGSDLDAPTLRGQNGAAAASGARCGHIGIRSNKQCVRPPHADTRHRYSESE